MTTCAPHGRWTWKQALLLASLVFLYVWLRIDPSLQFEATPRFPAFLRGPEFAAPFFVYAGGPLDYVAAWLAQYFYYAWAGAVIITLLVAIQCLAAERILARLSGRAGSWLALAPATLILVTYSQLGHHMADVMGVCLSSAGVVAYATLRSRKPAARAAAFLALSLVLYYLLGGAYLLFVVLCSIVEMATGAGRLVGLLYLLSGEAVPQLVGVYGLDLSPVRAFARNTPFDSTLFPVGRAILVALWALLIVAAAAGARRRARHAGDEPCSEARRPDRPPSGPPALRALLVAAVLVVPVLVSYREPVGVLLRVNQRLSQDRFEDAMDTRSRARLRLPPAQLVHATNYALYRLGRMSEEMFAYPQCPAGVMLGMVCGPEVRPADARLLRYTNPFECARAYLELGLVNQAEAVASEALEVYGPHATTLQLLAQVNLIKGRPEAAARFLQALADHPIRGGRAREQLDALGTDPHQSGSQRMQGLRTMVLTADAEALDVSLEQQCQALLRRNKRNRMAFEYLMASYLINRDLAGFAANIERVRDCGYASLPRHWQEALVVNEARTGQPAGLSGYRLDPAHYAAFIRFSGLVQPLQRQGASAAARAATAAEFGNTYYYYYVFGHSGVGQR